MDTGNKPDGIFSLGPKNVAEKRVLILGAGPVGLYTALKFFKGNYFSQAPLTTTLLQITIVEKRGGIKCNGIDTIAQKLLPIPYQELKSENKSLGEFHNLKDQMEMWVLETLLQ